MDRNCVNCKWYFNNKCHSNNINIMPVDNTKDVVTDFIEDGYLNEGIREEINLKELGRLFSDELKNNEYIKKSCVNKVKDEDYNNIDTDIFEYIDISISNIILNYFRNNKINTEIVINNPYDFNCCYWE